jgi:hypothetical protein
MKKHLRQREQFCVLLCCFVGSLTFYGRNCQAAEAAQPSTFCNPLNLPYRFSLESPSRREAADPAIVRWNIEESWMTKRNSTYYWTQEVNQTRFRFDQQSNPISSEEDRRDVQMR